MMSDVPDNSPQPQPTEGVIPSRLNFAERFNLSPVGFALIALAVVFVLYQVLGGTITFVVFGATVRPDTVQWLRLATMIGQLMLILVPTLFLARFQSHNLCEALRLRGTGSPEILLGIIGVLSLQQILQVYMNVQDLIPIPPSVRPFVESIRKAIEETYKDLVQAHSISELFYVLIVVALVPAFCEELLFRGLVQKNFERGLRGWWGIIVPGVIFGAYHFNPFSFVPLAVLGVYFGFLVFRSRSIFTSVVAHFANNVFAVLVIFFNPNESFLFRDGTIPVSVPTTIVTLAACGFVFALSTYAFIKITRVIPDTQVQ